MSSSGLISTIINHIFSYSNPIFNFSNQVIVMASVRLKRLLNSLLPSPISSHQKCSMKKSVLENFAKFSGKHMCQSLFFNKVAGLRPVNFVKFLRTPFLHNTSGRLHLKSLFLFEIIRIKLFLVPLGQTLQPSPNLQVNLVCWNLHLLLLGKERVWGMTYSSHQGILLWFHPNNSISALKDILGYMRPVGYVFTLSGKSLCGSQLRTGMVHKTKRLE